MQGTMRSSGNSEALELGHNATHTSPFAADTAHGGLLAATSRPGFADFGAVSQ
jgi:hypothetical protein